MAMLDLDKIIKVDWSWGWVYPWWEDSVPYPVLSYQLGMFSKDQAQWQWSGGWFWLMQSTNSKINWQNNTRNSLRSDNTVTWYGDKSISVETYAFSANVNKIIEWVVNIKTTLPNTKELLGTDNNDYHIAFPDNSFSSYWLDGNYMSWIISVNSKKWIARIDAVPQYAQNASPVEMTLLEIDDNYQIVTGGEEHPISFGIQTDYINPSSKVSSISMRWGVGNEFMILSRSYEFVDIRKIVVNDDYTTTEYWYGKPPQTYWSRLAPILPIPWWYITGCGSATSSWAWWPILFRPYGTDNSWIVTIATMWQDDNYSYICDIGKGRVYIKNIRDWDIYYTIYDYINNVIESWGGDEYVYTSVPKYYNNPEYIIADGSTLTLNNNIYGFGNYWDTPIWDIPTDKTMEPTFVGFMWVLYKIDTTVLDNTVSGKVLINSNESIDLFKDRILYPSWWNGDVLKQTPWEYWVWTIWYNDTISSSINIPTTIIWEPYINLMVRLNTQTDKSLSIQPWANNISGNASTQWVPNTTTSTYLNVELQA